VPKVPFSFCLSFPKGEFLGTCQKGRGSRCCVGAKVMEKWGRGGEGTFEPGGRGIYVTLSRERTFPQKRPDRVQECPLRGGESITEERFSSRQGGVRHFLVGGGAGGSTRGPRSEGSTPRACVPWVDRQVGQEFCTWEVRTEYGRLFRVGENAPVGVCPKKFGRKG